MTLKLYNTLSKKKEEFKPINKKEVKIYTCGPTVYWYAHVGNLRSYVFADVLKRTLLYNNYKVKQVINITDVGHLTSDSDEGQDKIEETASKEGRSANEISKFYFDAFHKDFKKLNLIEPDFWPKATAHIKEQIDLIKNLEKKGYTYKTDDGIYFDTSKFKGYGKFSKKDVKGLEKGKRTSMRNKKNKTDFALWKFSGNNKRLQEWDSPWGVGFPGWHIECSAMATKYLGKHFDIHTGGIDHIPIHHENEIAQSECGLGIKKWVNYWIHGEFLEIKGGKMSKSSGKVKTISELEKEGTDPLAYKYFTYTAHYRKPLTWSKDAIETAVNSYGRLKNILLELKGKGKVNPIYIRKFEERINDDLDMPGALAVLWEMLRDGSATGKKKTVERMDKIFGLKLFPKIPKEIKDLAEKRLKARLEEDWKQSDILREELLRKGWGIKDFGKGYGLEKK
jgi:cysteinyl-tRNA synthetase